MVLAGKHLKPGLVLRIDNHPWLIQQTESTMSGKTSSIIRASMKNLRTGHKTEKVYFAEDKVDDLVLDRKPVLLSAIKGNTYTFMDLIHHSMYEVQSEDIEGVVPYIEEGMQDICAAVFFEGKLVTIELPTVVSRKASYVDPSLAGDGRFKRAQLTNGTHVMVPYSIGADDMVQIDTRRGSIATTQ